MLISIIIPVYNSEKYLEKCIKSICNQTYKDLEIILVDDGSTDSSPAICDNLAIDDDRVIVIHKCNGGSTSARNAGLRVSHGEYIGFVDSDDWIEPEMYEVLMDECLREKVQIAVCNYCYEYGERTEYVNLCIPQGVYRNNDCQKTIIRNLFFTEDGKPRGISPALWDKLFSRDLLFQFQFDVDERTKYAEDDICVYSCLLNAEKVAFIDRTLYHYRKHLNSITGRVDDTYYEKISIFYQQMKRVIMIQPDSELLMKRLKKYMLSNVIGGVNRLFGFSNKQLISTFRPPFKVLKDVNAIILYGAGVVGREYYHVLQEEQFVEIVGWVDRQDTYYQQQGMPVEAIESILKKQYDAILIAIENENTAQIIRQELLKMGIKSEKILWEQPKTWLDYWGRMLV